MQILEYGVKTKPILILIHGFEQTYMCFEDYVSAFANDYHIFVPVLPNHDLTMNEEFFSFDACAEQIENYIINTYGNEVFAIYGMSMGGIVAASLWSRGNLKINKLIFESTPLLPYPEFIKKQITKWYIKMTNKVKNKNKKILEKMTKSIVQEKHLQYTIPIFENMNEDRVTRYINATFNYTLPMNIDTPNTEIYYFYGTTISEKALAKVASYLKKYYWRSNIYIHKNRNHCEDAIFNTQYKISQINDILIGKSI